MAAEAEKLKRESAGRYVSADGRFTVEQSSGRWVAIDAETADDLGLPLVRGPFGTLDDARAAVAEARSHPKATSSLADRLRASPKRRAEPRSKGSPASRAATPARVKAAARAPRKREPAIELRDYRPADGDALRSLWKSVLFRSVGDDDRSLAAFADRNPGLILVASTDDEVIGSALGGWDGRRGWIYHVAVAAPFRRKGLATRLVRRLEQRLRAAGAPKLTAIVRDENETAKAFWTSLGYDLAPTRQLVRTI